MSGHGDPDLQWRVCHRGFGVLRACEVCRGTETPTYNGLCVIGLGGVVMNGFLVIFSVCFFVCLVGVGVGSVFGVGFGRLRRGGSA